MSLEIQILVSCVLVFVAGFIDAIAGGGGLITLPAFNMIGLPSHTALGTNKFAVCWGTFFSTRHYVKNGYVFKSIVPITIVCAFVGSAIGAQIVLFLDEAVVRWMMIVLIPIIAVISVAKKDFLNQERQELPAKKTQVLAGIIALSIGMYDGFFGPGTGTFLIIAFVSILKLDAVTAGGNAKVVNMASNVAALITYVISGKVVYVIAIPCAICSVIGNQLGANLAVKRGARIIRPMMLVVVGLLLLTLVKDMVVSAMAAM